MNRTALGLLGVAVLAVSAQGIHRELAGSKNLWPSADAAPTRFRFTEHAAPRPLPDVRFRDGEGRAMSLSDFRVPTTLLIDRQGREIGRMAGPAEWDGPAAVGLVRRHLGAGGR